MEGNSHTRKLERKQKCVRISCTVKLKYKKVVLAKKKFLKANTKNISFLSLLAGGAKLIEVCPVV